MKGVQCISTSFVWLFLLLLVYAFQVDPAHAATGDILGRVIDETGGVLPGVTIVVQNVSTGLERTSLTGDTGGYSLALLPVGEYSITAELPGFTRERITGIVLQAGQRARVDITLNVGDIAEEVTVEGRTPLVKADSMDLGIVIGSQELDELPLNARSFVQLNALDSGAASRTGSNSSFYSRFGGNYSFQGSPSDSNNFLLDSIDIRGQNDVRVGLRVSMDAIQEFKSETGLYSAESGRGAGGHISIVTKSGSNEIHGSAFFFHRNDALDARNFFDPVGEKKPEFRQHQFGATIGGPIVRDQTFFFFSYEGWRIAKSRTRRYSVPPVEFRNGDFSSVSAAIYDPDTTRPDPNNPGEFIRDPFPGNVIPADRINPVSQNVLNELFPLPNQAGVSQNLIAAPLDNRDEDLYTIRIDHELSQKDHIFGRYSGVFDDTVDHIFSSLPNFADDFEVPSQNLVLSYTRTLNPATINEVKVGYNRMTQFLQDVQFGENINAGLGIMGTNPCCDYNPQVNISGFNRTGAISNAPNNRSENTFQFVDNFSYTRSDHTLGVGVDMRRIQINGGIEASPTGRFVFQNFYTRLPGDPTTGHAMADFLLGWTRSSSTSEGDGVRHHRTTHLGLYVKDDWNATPNLTVNLGLRYEYYSPNVEINNKLSNFLPLDCAPFPTNCPNATLVSGDEAGQFDLPDALFRSDLNNFAPRIGLAFRPFGDNRTVIRAGYGIYYTPQTTIQTMLLSSRNPPALLPFAFTGDSEFPDLPIENAFPDVKKVSSLTPWAQNDNYRIGYNQHYTLNMQKALADDLMLEVSYVGNKGTKLRLTRNINQPTPGPGGFDPRRPFPGFSSIIMIDQFGKSIYHGLKINVNKRFSDGLGFLLSYNWSKTLDEGGLFSFGESGDQLRRDVFDPRGERGRSIFDSRQRFVFSYVWELPFGPGRPMGANLSGFAGWLVGGWQMTGITTLQTGSPVDVYSAVDFANTGGGGRPDLVGDPNTGPKTPEKFFNTEAFVDPQVFTFGTAGRNLTDGPGIINFDISVIKSTYFGENSRLEFRAEFFNAFNRANFEGPGVAYTTGSFGRISAAADAREIQLGLKYFF